MIDFVVSRDVVALLVSMMCRMESINRVWA